MNDTVRTDPVKTEFKERHVCPEGMGDNTIADSDTLQVQIVRHPEELDDLREEWETLVVTSGAHIYQTFDWNYLWWKHFGKHPKRELHIIAFRHGGRLVGIIPLFKESCTILGIPVAQRLRLIGCGVPHAGSYSLFTQYGLSDYLDAIIVPEYAYNITRWFVEYCSSPENDFTELRLENVPEQSFLIHEFLQHARKAGLWHRLTPEAICPRLIVPPSLEQFFRGLQSGVRRRLVQAYRAAGPAGLFTIESIDDEEYLDEAFQHLKRLHQMRWNSAGHPGLFTDKSFEEFQKEVASRCMRQGWLWFKVARSNGSVIAARLGYKINGCLYDYLTGFDDTAAVARRRPGLALLVAMIEDAAREGIGVVDLLRGTENYKLEITSDSTRTWNVVIKKHQARLTLANMLWYIGEPLVHLWRRLARERLLLRVHYHQHGFPSFLYRYLVFLVQRIRRIAKHHHLQKQERKSGKSQSPRKSLSEAIITVLSRSRTSLLRKIARSLERDQYLPLQKKIRKGLVFLWSLMMSRLYLHAVDKLGGAARTRGRPSIDNLGRIMIGNGFNLNSRIVRSELATGPGGTIDIGDDVSINFGASISAQTKIKIGNRVRIGPYAMIIDSDFHTPGGDPYGKPTGQPITIEDDVWLGGRVTVLKGTTVGARSVITAGSVVTGIIPPDVIAGGVPARVLRRLKPVPEKVPQPVDVQSVDDEIMQRAKTVFMKTFNLASTVDLSWGPAQIARWDSLGHLNLIMALESEFGITMTEDDMLNIVSVRHACDIINRHMRNFTPKGAKQS